MSSDTTERKLKRNKVRDPKVVPFKTRGYWRPWKNSWLGLFLTKFMAPAVLVAAVALILFAWISARKFIPTLLIPALIVSTLLKALGKSLSDTEPDDGRAPIVYLREFSGEGTAAQIGHLINNFEDAATLEEYLQMALSPIGPLVALGKPKTWLEKAGASRRYVEDFEWRREIARMIDKSRLVLIQVGDSEFLLEEVKWATRKKSSDSILIYLKGKSGTFSGHSFREAARSLKFPTWEELEDGLFLWFNPSGEPIVLKAREKRPFLTLKPRMLLDMESALEPVVQHFTGSSSS